ncbi:MAG: hypothetical protein ACYDBH_25470 [Acidobacteriaceae bacterium]
MSEPMTVARLDEIEAKMLNEIKMGIPHETPVVRDTLDLIAEVRRLSQLILAEREMAAMDRLRHHG